MPKRFLVESKSRTPDVLFFEMRDADILAALKAMAEVAWPSGDGWNAVTCHSDQPILRGCRIPVASEVSGHVDPAGMARDVVGATLASSEDECSTVTAKVTWDRKFRLEWVARRPPEDGDFGNPGLRLVGTAWMDAHRVLGTESDPDTSPHVCEAVRESVLGRPIRGEPDDEGILEAAGDALDGSRAFEDIDAPSM